MRKYIKYGGLLFLLIEIVLLYGFSSHRNGRKKVTDINIKFQREGKGFLTHKMVNKLLIQNQKSIKNQAKRVIDLQRLEQNMLNNPYVEKATVFLTVDGRLQTNIKQREPIARIVTSPKVYYIDNQGVRIPLSDNYSARVPLISGVTTKNDIQQITELLHIILKNDFLRKEIVGIRKSAKEEFIFDVRSGNYKIEFGKMKDATIKFKKLIALYNKTFEDKTIKIYKKINLKYHNQVVCTK